MRARNVSGTLNLLRPNDPRADRTVMLPAMDTGTYVLRDLDLLPGRYNVLLEWRADDIAYFTEEKVYVE